MLILMIQQAFGQRRGATQRIAESTLETALPHPTKNKEYTNIKIFTPLNF